MIIVCPACETRFLVDDAALGGAAGRRLRCANCGHVWLYSPVPAPEPEAVIEPKPAPGAPPIADEPVLVEPAAPEPAPATALRAEPRIEDVPASDSQRFPGPAAAPRPTEAAVPSQQGAHSMAALGLILFAVAVLGAIVVFGAVAARGTLVELWDKATRTVLAHSGVGRSSAPQSATDTALGPDAKPGAGLKVTVVPTRTADSLVIDGDIVNSAPVARPVPRLRVTLRDGNRGDLGSKLVDPPVVRLPPGATAHFSAVFDHPSVAASNVDVSFATD